MTAVDVSPADASLPGLRAPHEVPTRALQTAPDRPTRLSDSPLWERQRQFYDAGAADLWATGIVPHGITSNPRIASTYARLALSFLQAASRMPADGAVEPGVHDGVDVPHFVELGGGTGRFAYLFVRHLRELAPALRFTYVLTDFAVERVAAWAEHPGFGALVEAGFIDFAVLDADRPGPLDLVVSGRTLQPGSLRAPVVGIANYVFDSLRHDSFIVRGGGLLESRVTVTDGPPGDAGGPPAVIHWTTEPTGEVDETIAPVLGEYCQILDDTAVLVPTGGLRCLEFVADLTYGPSCTLVADKGHCTPVELCSQQSPAVVYHGTGFSLMVNFDLLARYTRSRGWRAILPRDPARSLVVASFVRGDIDDPAQFECWVQDLLLDTGPDNYFTLRSLLTAGSPAVDTVLAALRLSRFDPALLIEVLQDLLELLPAVPDSVRHEVDLVLMRVWRNFFDIGEPVDMALCVGLAYSAMQRFTQAASFFELSVKVYPDSAPAAFSMAVARRGQHDLGAALQWVEKALELEPGFSEARALRSVLREEVGAGLLP